MSSLCGEIGSLLSSVSLRNRAPRENNFFQRDYKIYFNFLQPFSTRSLKLLIDRQSIKLIWFQSCDRVWLVSWWPWSHCGNCDMSTYSNLWEVVLNWIELLRLNRTKQSLFFSIYRFQFMSTISIDNFYYIVTDHTRIIKMITSRLMTASSGRRLSDKNNSNNFWNL